MDTNRLGRDEEVVIRMNVPLNTKIIRNGRFFVTNKEYEPIPFRLERNEREWTIFLPKNKKAFLFFTIKPGGIEEIFLEVPLNALNGSFFPEREMALDHLYRIRKLSFEPGRQETTAGIEQKIAELIALGEQSPDDEEAVEYFDTAISLAIPHLDELVYENGKNKIY